ncbi:DUF418 domain-containing protein [Brumicola nitratireducens]|uniref:DUF418 domain-containing protein n=1 Tax=Glaciecola nitratireducens (strain JCM 12485 / KCTC 12276 / FR1064) TaxID=1085623 RepID=G4QJU9_GLANF|nr:DUF418 domain-containing protein [Glaciecola nitratireducens]AEP28991.1 hypothetical protein GNIT_0853 [Glaciecola nitratireducens FR1064]
MRLTSIDALRGMAILGILLMNIPFHANLELGYVPFSPILLSDQVMTLFHSIFADGRFRTLFCLLFGAGLAIQYDSCIRKEVDPKIFIKSRLKWLFVFGFIHGVFVFGGDVLMLYSLVGYFLIDGLSLDNKGLLQKSRKFLIIGCTIIFIIAMLMLIFSDPSERVVRGTEEYFESVAYWQGNWGYQTMINAGFSIGLLILSPLFNLWQALGLMYLGSYLYRSGFFIQGFSRSVLVKISILAVVSTLLCIAPQIFIKDIDSEVIPAFSSISAIFVALVYAHIVVKLCQSKSRIMSVLANTGKVAFSLYILQSIAMGILLRWLIPEFSLEATHLDYLLIVIAFTVIQIVIGQLYLYKFKQGPLELLWRSLYNRSIHKALRDHIAERGSEARCK